MTATQRIVKIGAQMVRVLGRGPRAAPPSSLRDLWQQGYDAFLRGEIAPVDPHVAEGWYWAENEASRRRPLP